MPEGIVYILINEAMPGYAKVGKTATTVEQRMKELDTSGVPLPFECFYAARVADMDMAEKRLHDAYKSWRVRPRREFFRVSPEEIASALQMAEGEEVTPRADVVEDAEDQAALNQARERRSVFNFRMVDISPGATLTFIKDSSVTCTVRDNKRVEFEGNILSLSASALIAIRRIGYTWTVIPGPEYWKYKNETLDARRRRMEEED